MEYVEDDCHSPGKEKRIIKYFVKKFIKLDCLKHNQLF